MVRQYPTELFQTFMASRKIVTSSHKIDAQKPQASCEPLRFGNSVLTSVHELF